MSQALANTTPTHFILDDTLYQVSEIEVLRIDGYPAPFSAYGNHGWIKLKGWVDGKRIGSDANKEGHIPHLIADFRVMRAIMHGLGSCEAARVRGDAWALLE